MSESKPRKAVAEIRFGQDRSGITKVGGRPIHQYWNLLAPHFRDVLLAPQRRSDDIGVSWTWKEPAGNKPLTAAELAGVRNRLAGANRLFLESPQSAVQGEDASGGLNAQKIVEQLGTGVKSLMAKLSAKNDTQLSSFVCRTESGTMIHSWGVSTPAEPYYPENVECEVSGIVVVSGKASAGHEVVMENAKGASVARTRSDEAGAFNFCKVFPGRYRVRVISDPVDFPLKGVTVVVERESITRLELRSSSNPADREKTQPSESSHADPVVEPPMPVSAQRSHRRKLVPILIVLAALITGGGGWIWWKWSTAEPGLPANVPPVSAHPPARTEQPAESGEPALAATPVRVTSSGAGWGALAGVDAGGAPAHRLAQPVVPAAKKPVRHKSDGLNKSADKKQTGDSSSDPARSEDAGSDNKATREEPARPASTAEESGAPTDPATAITAGKISSDEKPSAPVAVEPVKSDGPDATAAENNPTADTAPSAPSQPAKTAPAATPVPAQAAKALAARKATDAPAVIAKPAAKVAAISGTSAEEALSGINPSGGSPVSDAGPAKAGAAADEGSATNGGTSGSGDDSAGAAPSGGSASAAASAGPQPSALGPAAKAAASGNLVAAAGKKVKKKASTQTGKPASASNSDVATPSKADASTGGPSSGSAPTATTAPENPPAPAAAAAEPAPATEAPEAAAPDVSVVVAAPSDQKATTDKSSANPNPSRKAGAVQKTVTAANKTSSTAGPSPAISVAPSSGSPAVQLAPTDAGSPMGVADSKTLATAPTQNPETGASGLTDKPQSSVPAISDEVELVQRTGVRVTPWAPQLVEDVIVPTEPVRVGEDDAVETKREKLLQEQKSRMAQTFKNPVVQGGCAFDLPPETNGATGRPRWRDANGASPEGATVQGGRAEIVWPGGMPPRAASYVLSASDGREIARVSTDPDGELVCQVRQDVRSWYWIGIGQAASDSGGAVAEQGTPRFEWQLLHGPEIPASWHRDDHWLGGRGHRIELPLGEQTGGLTGCTLALVDRLTGWALVGEIRRKTGASSP